MLPFRTCGRAKKRFIILEVKGNCLGKLVPEGSFLIVDTRAVVRFGDIVVMEGRENGGREAKFFAGRTQDLIEVFMLNPPGALHVKLSELNYACRVRAIIRWGWIAPLIMSCIRLRFPRYERKLGVIAAAAEEQEIICLKQ